MTDNNGKTKQPKQPTEVEALAKITRVLNQLTPEQRAKVLRFLVE